MAKVDEDEELIRMLGASVRRQRRKPSVASEFWRWIQRHTYRGHGPETDVLSGEGIGGITSEPPPWSRLSEFFGWR